MRNRAKCKLCNKIIESIHANDYVMCACGEIAISGGDQTFKASAKNFDHFLRVDDEGNEIITMLVESEQKETIESIKPTKEEMLSNLETYYRNIESLPSEGQFSMATQSDLSALIAWLLEYLRSD